MSAIVKSAAGVAVGSIAVGGSVMVIPLTPILIGAGIIAGTIIAVAGIRTSPKLKIAKLQTKAGDDKFYLQASAGDFCSVNANAGNRLVAKVQFQESDYFEMLKTEDGRFAFQASNNLAVAVDRNQGGVLVANQLEVRESELFTLEEQKDSFVAFKSSHGKYLSLYPDAGKLLRANASSIGATELFRILIMKDQITITKTIEIRRTVTVNLGIHNYKEIVEHYKGWFVGKIFNWFFREKSEEEIRKQVKEQLEAELKSQIEDAINKELDARLSEEATRRIGLKLKEKIIEATVVTTVK